MKQPVVLDCTLRDGGYYNAWDFPPTLVTAYLEAMRSAAVDVVELGFRTTSNKQFAGPWAFTTEDHLGGIPIPERLKVAVMVNGSDLLARSGCESVLRRLFPVPASQSLVSIVRIACHFHEFRSALPAVTWLKDRGYTTGINVMQIADRARNEVLDVALAAKDYPPDVLYFADSTGGMRPDDVARIIEWLRHHWPGDLGIHTHDNMGLALSNTLHAYEEGATWLDATVTGMGRGPGNARMEELLIEVDSIRNTQTNLVPLMTLIRKVLQPLKNSYGWGTNPYYYLAGKFGIHPTYIQEMLGDARFTEEDMFAVIDRLKNENGKKFDFNNLEAGRQFYRGELRGTWAPSQVFEGRDVLILGGGGGVGRYSAAIESYIRRHKPIVLALNTQDEIDPRLVDMRVACHPVRLLADCGTLRMLPQPIITPASMLPDEVRAELRNSHLLDFGMLVESGKFEVKEKACIIPSPLVIAYALAVAASGRAKKVLLAGVDGYTPGDPRNKEMDTILETVTRSGLIPEISAITPTKYQGLRTESVYGL